MKKKVLIAALCILVLAGGVLAKLYLIGSKPLRGLTAGEVTSATVELYPPDATLELTQEVIFTLTKTDGTQLRVQAYNPFIVIDGVGYRTKYEPCEDLNQLGNDILRERR